MIAEAFNQHLANWNISQVTDMSCMFKDCTSFNQSLANWNVLPQETDTSSMFEDCTSFNRQSLASWYWLSVPSYCR